MKPDPTELQNVAVYGDSKTGWDENTPVNETVDADGNPFPESVGFGVPDPHAPKTRAYDDPSVVKLRQHLRQNNGIYGLEICAPDEVDRIARIFHRDGFVVVRDLLNTDQLDKFRVGCARMLRQILELGGDGDRKYMTESFRLPHRYSYGTSSASRQLMHDQAWTDVIDLPTTTPLLTKIFGSDNYRVWGGGGDLCLPGAVEYQHLHSDLFEKPWIPEARIEQAEQLGLKLKWEDETEELDLHTKQHIMELTPSMVTINFVMSDLTWENGPIRQIPGTHTARQYPPKPVDEPEWMRLSTLVGAKAGAGVIRDNRAWHGATPNLSKEIRALPNIEYSAPWTPREQSMITMPHEIWETLSPHAQKLCRYIKSDPGEWPKGAGIMHPFANKRKEAYENGTL
ncbi:MAG: phytanoyl-CoA dioxygenase family protein [bacterium]|nr:hypothetical protein [Gammaproteobacteria bacterium]HIL98051.1 hypothetical protein [Pseudomonadales bacterium]